MGLSRKRERELKRLRSSASELWDNQREVLEHASKVVKEAGKQVRYLGREEVAPRFRETIDHRIKPSLASGVAVTRHVADTAKDKIAHDVLPAVAGALASALTVIEVAKEAKLKEVSRHFDNAGAKAAKAGARVGTKVGIVKPSHGPGRYILLGLAVVAAAGLAYAAWQTLREDDDLWISDEFDALEKPSEPDAR